jgi:hypothetical protein
MTRSQMTRRIELLAGRMALFVAGLGVLHWAWLIVAKDGTAPRWNENLSKALVIPATAVILLAAVWSDWSSKSLVRTAGRIVFASVALFWLSCFYWTTQADTRMARRRGAFKVSPTAPARISPNASVETRPRTPWQT